MDAGFDVVTGALGYSGRFITQRLLSSGRRVRTLTGHPARPNPFADAIEVRRLAFDNPRELTENLRGADTLFNTYWVRFGYGRTTFRSAIENTRRLFAAAVEAGVRRVVHVSITNPSPDSPLPYFSGKAECEAALVATGLPHAIVRPAVLFGHRDVLINNIAWFLRRFPVFLVPGDGTYRLQPVFVEDFADLCVRVASLQENTVVDAVGPEIFTFDGLIEAIACRIGRPPRRVHLPPALVRVGTSLAGILVKDVVLTRDEIRGLMADLLVSSAAPTCPTRLSDWLSANAVSLGLTYASELARHYR